MTMDSTKVSNILIGIAGVHFVVYQLSLRGLIALPTIRNTKGADILVASTDGSWHANLQVKTSQYKVSFWPIGAAYERWLGKDNFYVFVRSLPKESRFEAFLESANVVAPQVRRDKDFAPTWLLPKDERELERLRGQWREFGPKP